MVFSPKVEVDLNGWTDLTSYALAGSGLSYSRGFSAEGSSPSAGALGLTLNNEDDRFGEFNPTGPYYGYLGRNVGVRVSLPGTARLSVPILKGTNHASTPDSAALSVTGDLDVRLDAEVSNWQGYADLIGKYITTGNQRSWELCLWHNLLWFRWSTNGSSFTDVFATVAVPAPLYRRMSIRVTLDVDNGASGSDVTFYTSSDTDLSTASWTQLGDVVTNSGTTSIYDSTASLYIGRIAGDDIGGILDLEETSPTSWSHGQFYSAQVRDGIGGSLVADPDFTAQTGGVSSFDDDQGNTWTMIGDAEIVDRSYRWRGEASSWTPQADQSGNALTTLLDAGGPLRRLSQGSSDLRSAYYRACTSPTAPLEGLRAYWPCEDPDGSSQISSGLSDGLPMNVHGTVSLASTSAFDCSEALPSWTEGGACGAVASYTSTGIVMVRFLLSIPAGGLAADATLVRILTGGSIYWTEVGCTTAGSLTLDVYDQSLTSVHSGVYGFNANGAPMRVTVLLEQDGSDVDWRLEALTPAGGSGYNTGTISSQDVTTVTRVDITPMSDGDGVVLGHVTVQDITGDTYDILRPLHAFSDDPAGYRVWRLCKEQDLTGRSLGELRYTGTMGSQLAGSVVSVLTEAMTRERGLLYELRDVLGAGYVSVSGMASVDPTLTLDHATGDLSALVPRADDQGLVNAVTVNSPGVGRAEYEVTSGRLSTLAPPNGVGRYAKSITVNSDSPLDLGDIPSWIAHVGTHEGYRFPTLTVELHRAPFTDSAALTAQALAVDVGSMVRIENPPARVSTDDIDLLVIGLSEYLDRFTHTITYVCVPYHPYRIAVVGSTADTDQESRISNSTTTLSSYLTSSKATFAGSECMSVAGDNVAGDLEVIVKAAADDWTPSSEKVMVAKYNNAGGANQRSWAFDINPSGYPHLYWSTNGSSFTGATCTALTGFTDGTEHYLKVTLDVDNGSSQYEVKFYVSDDGGTWTQLGSTITGGSTTSVFASTADYQLGARSATNVTSGWDGYITEVRVHDGIDGDDLVPEEPDEWTDGYSGSGTGTVVADQTSSVAGIAFTGIAWGHGDGDYDLKIGGQRVTVTAVAGTSSPQVLSIDRSVNGVVAAHAAGTAVELFRPVYIGVNREVT